MTIRFHVMKPRIMQEARAYNIMKYLQNKQWELMNCSKTLLRSYQRNRLIKSRIHLKRKKLSNKIVNHSRDGAADYGQKIILLIHQVRKKLINAKL